jgi:hypothetical protein
MRLARTAAPLPRCAKLRRQDSNLRDAINSRASDRSTTPEQVAPAGVEPASCRARAGSSAVLSYGAVSVAGRTRTCGASRFGRPLYRSELRPRVSGRGWARTSSLLFVRQALSALELLAQGNHSGLRDKDSNLDLRVQSAVSWPLDDPGRSVLLFMPLAHASTLDRSGATAAVRLRGGVLEPGARFLAGNVQAKAAVIWAASITAFQRRGPFSLRRGLDSVLGLLQAEHHLASRVDSPSNDEGDPLGSPSLRAAMPLHV